MSGTFPAAPAPRHITARSVAPTKVSFGHSLKRQARSLGGQRWGFRLQYAPMTHAQFAPIWGFIVAQRSRYETFNFSLLSRVWPLRGAGGGTPVVNNQAGSPEELQTGARNVVTSGWPATANVLLTGDWVQYAGHTKVYIATATIASSGAGAATIVQEPALVVGPAHNAAITIGPSVVFNCSLAGDEQEFMARPRGGSLGLYEFEIDLEEAY